MTTHFDEKGKFFTDIISKESVPVIIQTETNRIHGLMHVRHESRLKDELNNEVGFMAITNKRLIFISSSVNRNIRLSNIIGIEGASDGLQINRTNKVKKEIFRFDVFKAQIAIAILNTILRE